MIFISHRLPHAHIWSYALISFFHGYFLIKNNFLRTSSNKLFFWNLLIINYYVPLPIVTCREVHEEVNQARENASELKLRRQEQAAARREKLRQAYIRKQLEKVKSTMTTKQEQT